MTRGSSIQPADWSDSCPVSQGQSWSDRRAGQTPLLITLGMIGFILSCTTGPAAFLTPSRSCHYRVYDLQCAGKRTSWVLGFDCRTNLNWKISSYFFRKIEIRSRVATKKTIPCCFVSQVRDGNNITNLVQIIVFKERKFKDFETINVPYWSILLSCYTHNYILPYTITSALNLHFLFLLTFSLFLMFLFLGFWWIIGYRLLLPVEWFAAFLQLSSD